MTITFCLMACRFQTRIGRDYQNSIYQELRNDQNEPSIGHGALSDTSHVVLNNWRLYFSTAWSGRRHGLAQAIPCHKRPAPNFLWRMKRMVFRCLRISLQPDPKLFTLHIAFGNHDVGNTVVPVFRTIFFVNIDPRITLPVFL